MAQGAHHGVGNEPAPSSDDNERHILVLSGGAWRGAFQFWVIEYLLSALPIYSIHGVSVGSINGVMAASGKMPELFEFWKGLSGLRGFLSLRYVYLAAWALGFVWAYNSLAMVLGLPYWIGGVYSMNPILRKLKKHVSLDGLKYPYSAGMVDLCTGVYHTVHSDNIRTDADLWGTVLASSCMVPLMQPRPVMVDGGQCLGFDGGGKNIFPVPADHIKELREAGYRVVVHAVGCTPIGSIANRSVRDLVGMFNQAIAGFEALEREVYETDILQLRQAVGPEGEVRVYAPQVEPGGVLDGSPARIKARLDESREMVARGPVVLQGISG